MSDTLSPTPTDDEPFDLEREPLEKPHPMARDWGGDGSDLSRPVRVHMLAALRPNTAPTCRRSISCLRLATRAMRELQSAAKRSALPRST